MSQGTSSLPSPSNAVNGVPKRSKKKGPDESHVDRGSLCFGKLTQRMGSEMEVLRPAYNALSNISNLFQEYRSEIEIFERDFDTIKAKDDEIRDRRTAMRLWESTKDEEIGILKGKLQAMSDDRKRFLEDRQEFELVRDRKLQEIIQNERQLEEKEDQLKDMYEQKVKKRKDALKQESREQVTQLKTTNEKLSKEIVDLKADLAGVRQTLANEKNDWSIVRSSISQETRGLREELETLKHEFAIEERPDSFYLEKFLDIQESIKKASAKFFTRLPQSTSTSSQQTRILENRENACEIAEFAFLSGSQVSTSLRLSTAECFIVDTLRRLVWQPFAPGISSDEKTCAARFEALSQTLSSHGTRSESIWRALTIHGLCEVSAKQETLERAVGCMLKLLAPFTDEPSDGGLLQALTDIVNMAMDVWDISRRDVCQISIQIAPDPADKGGWMREDEDLFDIPDDKMDADMNIMSPVCIFPKVVRGETSPMIILRGRALFQDSRLVALGRKESTDLQRVINETHRNFASQKDGKSGLRDRSDRRSSIAAQMNPNPRF